MKKQLIYLAATLLFMLTGCDKNTENNPSDGTIGLSATDTLRFTGLKDTVRLRTTGSQWWFSRIKVNGTDQQFDAESQKEQLRNQKFSQTWDWLTVNRDADQIMLIVATNDTPNGRAFELLLESENSSETIRGFQRIRLDGEWEDCIGLSGKNVSFASGGGSATVETKESGWWVSSIEVNGVATDVNQESSAQLEKEKEYLKKTDWLTVHITGKKIELTADPNTTGKERSFKLRLQAGDYFDTVEGSQEK